MHPEQAKQPTTTGNEPQAAGHDLLLGLMENQMETTIMENQMENTIMENQMEKQMEN